MDTDSFWAFYTRTVPTSVPSSLFFSLYLYFFFFLLNEHTHSQMEAMGSDSYLSLSGKL